MTIGILSQTDDSSTDNVIDWLSFYDIDFVRINEEELNHCKIEFNILNNKNSLIYVVNDEIINFDDIDMFWNRKWNMSSFNYNETLPIEVGTHINDEFFVLKTFILQYLHTKNKLIGFVDGNANNKIIQLIFAKKNNLLIPETQIINNRSSINFINPITKPLSNVISIKLEDKSFLTSYTSKVNTDSIPKEFGLSLIQENIFKEYEIRTFFIDNTIYSMAMFSTLDINDNVDFRRTKAQNNIKRLPYSLPFEVAESIISLMKDLNLEMGSIDLIKSTNGKYYFLEVNPNGQYGMLSNSCNYNLDKIIANYLINMTNEIKRNS